MDVVTVDEATKVYGKRAVLDSVSLSFAEGQIHGIVGRNGSGKTVLFKAICGFVPLTTGRILVRGMEIGKDTDVPPDVGIIIEAPGFLPNYGAYGNLRLLSRIKGIISAREIRDVIATVGLDPKSKKHVGKFSMGMRQRLGLAQAIMEDPSLLILDEPFNGLDISGVAAMRELLLRLKDEGKTILMASHSREDVELLCDTVHTLDNGRVVQALQQSDLPCADTPAPLTL